MENKFLAKLMITFIIILTFYTAYKITVLQEELVEAKHTIVECTKAVVEYELRNETPYDNENLIIIIQKGEEKEYCENILG